MNATGIDDTEFLELLQILIVSGLRGFPEVMTRIFNIAMRIERELHIGAHRYEHCEERNGYANGYKPKTLKTSIGKLHLSHSVGKRLENTVLSEFFRARNKKRSGIKNGRRRNVHQRRLHA